VHTLIARIAVAFSFSLESISLAQIAACSIVLSQFRFEMDRTM
jgi:hypothetical protein